MKMAFIVMTEQFKHQGVYTMLKMIDQALAKGHQITGIFFFGSGVHNVRKKAHLGTIIRNIPAELEKLTQQKIPIYACQTWADNFGIEPSDLISGAQITGLGELSTLAHEAEKIVVFGAKT